MTLGHGSRSTKRPSWRFLREVRQRRVRLGRSGWGRQVLLEDLARRAIAEAAPGRIVEPVGEPPQADMRERLGLAVAGQEASDAAVRVLHAALLPGTVRVAEVARQGEMAAAVEGDGPPRRIGQPPEHVGDAGDDRRRALVPVRQQEGEPALSLQQRGHVGLAVLLAEDQQVGLPVPERLARLHLRRPALDPALARDRGGARLASVAGPAPAARLREVTVEAIPAALRAVDVAVDRLVADGGPLSRLVPEPPGDLLRRPAGREPLDHVRPQAAVGFQLPTSPPTPAGQIVGGQGEVAAEAAVAVAEAVAPELAVDRRAMPTEPGGDLPDRPTGLHQAEEGAPLVEVELAVGFRHSRLPRASLSRGWGVALRDRTHPRPRPGRRRRPPSWPGCG